VAAAMDLRAVAMAVARLRPPPRPTGWMWAWVAALLPSLLIVALVSLSPALGPDGAAYHLTVPKLWLRHGSLQYLPTYPYSNTPMGVEMLFAIALSFAGDAAAKGLHFCLGSLGAIGIFLAGRRLRGSAVGAAVATLYLVGPAGVTHLLGWAYVEGAAACAVIAATLAWVIWFQGRQPGWLRCAALLGGFAVSFKMTAALFPLALAGLTLLVLSHELREQGRPLGEGLRPLWRLLPLVAAPVLPWSLRSALVTGNPVFPLFAQWIPSRDYSPALAAAFESHQRYMIWAASFGADWGLRRRQLTLAAAALLAVLAAGFALWGLRSRMARSTTLVVLATVLVQLAAAGLYVRYWVPIFAVLALPVAVLCHPLLSSRLGPPALVALALIGSVSPVRISLSSVANDVPGLWRNALGLRTQRAFLLDHHPLYPLYEKANRDLPADAGVLLCGVCHGFYIDRSTFCDKYAQESIRFTTWGDFTDDLRRLGITHVIAPRTLASGGPPPPYRGSGSVEFREKRDELLGRLLADHGRLLMAAADRGLYALDRRPLR